MNRTLGTLSRRDFLGGLSLGALAVRQRPAKTHVITLSFDDGFRKSSIETARIFSKHGLPACINVIATAHHEDFVLPNAYHRFPAGDFGLWNELAAEGHEIMPHSYSHQNLAALPLRESQELILRCLDYFSESLDNFEASRSIFNFPYNASTPDLEEWLSDKVLAYRTGYARVNPLPHAGQKKLICSSHGPGNIDAFLTAEMERFLASEGGWYIFNAHGLDEEGWGPLSSELLDTLLGEWVQMQHVEVIPAGRALQRFD